MATQAELWELIHAAFLGHRGPNDVTAQDALERIAVKCIGLPRRRAFDASNCSVREARLSTEHLGCLKVYHPRADPKRLGGPIVLISYQGRLVVVDGNNRVNLWISQSARGPFHAIIIEPTDDRQ